MGRHFHHLVCGKDASLSCLSPPNLLAGGVNNIPVIESIPEIKVKY